MYELLQLIRDVRKLISVLSVAIILKKLGVFGKLNFALRIAITSVRDGSVYDFDKIFRRIDPSGESLEFQSFNLYFASKSNNHNQMLSAIGNAINYARKVSIGSLNYNDLVYSRFSKLECELFNCYSIMVEKYPHKVKENLDILANFCNIPTDKVDTEKYYEKIKKECDGFIPKKELRSFFIRALNGYPDFHKDSFMPIFDKIQNEFLEPQDLITVIIRGEEYLKKYLSNQRIVNLPREEIYDENSCCCSFEGILWHFSTKENISSLVDFFDNKIRGLDRMGLLKLINKFTNYAQEEGTSPKGFIDILMEKKILLSYPYDYLANILLDSLDSKYQEERVFNLAVEFMEAAPDKEKLVGQILPEYETTPKIVIDDLIKELNAEGDFEQIKVLKKFQSVVLDFEQSAYQNSWSIDMNLEQEHALDAKEVKPKANRF